MPTPEAPPLSIGLKAAKANFIPGLIIQLFIVAIVVSYYRVPGVAEALAGLARTKEESGYLFALLAGMIAGGILPEILVVLVFQKGRVRRENWRNLLFMMAVWGGGSVIIDAFYRLQTMFYGSGTDLWTIIRKMLTDQFVYTPLVSTPYGILAYKWRNNELPRPGEFFTLRYYGRELFPTLIANWGVWTPLVCLVYAMPAPLQVPLYSLILTFWVLLFSWINRKKEGGAVNTAAESSGVPDQALPRGSDRSEPAI